MSIKVSLVVDFNDKHGRFAYDVRFMDIDKLPKIIEDDIRETVNYARDRERAFSFVEI